MACDELMGGWDIYGPCYLHPRRPGSLEWPWPQRRPRPGLGPGPATAVPRPPSRGFTLVELLVVVVIIGLISLVTLPVVLPAWNHREVTGAAQVVQSVLNGARARAAAIHRPAGIRLLPDASLGFIGGPFLPGPPNAPPGFTPTVNPYAGLPDPTQILAYDRILPIESAPSYREGRCTPISAATIAYLEAAGVPVASYPPGGAPVDTMGQPLCLVVVESVVDPTTGAPNAPTSWFWNVRVGDRIQFNSAGPWYTVIGPMAVSPANPNPQYQGNTELFVNAGPPGAAPLLTTPVVGGQPVEYLLLVNGVDDNRNGWTDEGFDGVDNNLDGVPDNLPEWERETWRGSIASHSQANLAYTIERRPAPGPNAQAVALPSAMVVDATTWHTSRERSRLPVNPLTGVVDIVVNPDGTVVPTTVYSTPSSRGMSAAWLHVWLAEREDVIAPREDSGGNLLPWAPGAAYTLPIPEPGSAVGSLPGPYLKGERMLVSLEVRSGTILVNRNPPALFDPTLGYQAQRGSWGASYPFLQAEQGVTAH